MRTNRTDALAEMVREYRARTKLDTWNAFVEDLQVPSDLYPAMMTQRPALLPKATAKTAEEVQVLYKIIATLIETNAALRQHTEQTAGLVSEWHAAFKGLSTIAGYIDTFANLKKDDDEMNE